MSRLLRHSDADNLMRYADGELPASQARKVRSHLQSCWQCRTELEEMQKVVGECVRYRKTVLEPHLPPPPAAWGDLSYKFDEIDATLDRPSWLERLRPAMRWVPVAAALAVAWLAYNQLRDTPSVQAAELLRKAIAAADAAPAPVRRVRIRTRQHTVIRPAAAKSEETGPLEPLSARSYQQWRNQLPQKHDVVASVDGNYQIRTSTPSGDLAEATLQLRMTDLHAVQERLEFRNHDWVEIEEVQEDALPPATMSAESVHPPVAVSAPDAPATSEEIRQPAPAATVGDELSVLVALHNVGADLGDPVEVKRQRGQILVAGIGVDPQRRQEIEQALGARRNVVVRFSDPDGTASQPEKPAAGAVPPGADVTALQGRIEKQAGGRANYERLSTDALDASESMMARAYALRRIAERFPRSVDAEMTASDRQVLRDLYREHATALARQAGDIERLLKPVLVPLGGKVTSAPPAAAESWQAGTEHLFTIARRVETLLAVMLGVAPGEAAGRDIPSQVLSTLVQLRTSAEAYGPAGNIEPRP
jgi:anti-sigma factor RsiW